MTVVTLTELSEFGFVETHEVKLQPDYPRQPRFVALKKFTKSDTPSVYLWLSKEPVAEDTRKVIYVGKAGKGVARRCLQHQAGFINSVTGRKNAEALTSILEKQGVAVTVWSRKAGEETLFNVKVSLYAAEEAALCARFAPLLNRAAFPATSEPDPTENPGAATGREQSRHLVGERIVPAIDTHLRLQDEGTQDDLMAQLDAYDPPALEQLARMLEVVRRHILQPDHALKLVREYTDQVQGCNHVTTLGFGTLAGQKFSPNGWVTRIYLCDDAPRIAFPLRRLNNSKKPSVYEAKDSFSPKDIEDFLQNPGAFFAPGDFFTQNQSSA